MKKTISIFKENDSYVAKFCDPERDLIHVDEKKLSVDGEELLSSIIGLKEGDKVDFKTCNIEFDVKSNDDGITDASKKENRIMGQIKDILTDIFNSIQKSLSESTTSPIKDETNSK